MANKPIKKAAVEKKVKRWIAILAPKEFGNITLGETYIEEPIQAKGKVLTLNMMAVTGDPKKQNTNLRFIANEVKGSQVETILTGFEIPPAHVKRMARKARSKIEDSFICKCNDGINVRVKPIIVLKANAARSIQTNIRIGGEEEVKKRAASVDHIKFLHQMLKQETQKQLKAELKKIYPVSSYTIRYARIEK